MSLTDYIKKATVGLAIVGALGGSAYAGEPSREEMQKEFQEFAQLSSWYNANLAYQHGKKNLETGAYELNFKNKKNGTVFRVSYVDTDGNGPDLGDIVTLSAANQGYNLSEKTEVKSTARVLSVDEKDLIFE